MDDESGESMEPMEEVPLKELGETESSSGIFDDEDCVFRISGGGSYECCLLSRVLKTNSFLECALGYLYVERRCLDRQTPDIISSTHSYNLDIRIILYTSLLA